MLIVVEGRVGCATGPLEPQQLIAAVEPGRVLGDCRDRREPRFATCVAVQPTLVAMLDAKPGAHHRRAALLGAKILMGLVLMLSQRLRATSDRLMQLLDEQGPHGAGHV